MAKIQKTANTADKKPVYRVKEKPTLTGILATLFFTIISIIFVSPIIIVIINSPRRLSVWRHLNCQMSTAT